MGRYWHGLRIAAAAGAAGGLLASLPEVSTAWLRLSGELVARRVAVGWVVGAALSPLVSVVLARRARPLGEAPRRWRRLGRAALTLAAAAPLLLWMTLLVPRGLLCRAIAPGRAVGDTRPNLVLITIDALRADHLGAYGRDRGLTPNLEAFAREATVYSAACACAPWTMPSFGAMLSGLSPSRCGLKVPEPQMNEWYTYQATLPADVPLVSERLRAAGYATAAELTNPFLAAQKGWRRGFDSFRNEDESDPDSLSTRARRVTGAALAWLRLNRREPFFLWVHYLDPHIPYDSPATSAQARAAYPEEWWGTRRAYWYDFMQSKRIEQKTRYQDFCRRMYAEEVRYADAWVGKLLDGLRRRPDYDDMLIVLTSDHGEELFDHGGFEHGHTMHEELLRVPLLVKWPRGWAADRTVGQTVALSSLAATLLEAAGEPPTGDEAQPPLPRRNGERGVEVYSEGVLHGWEQTALTTDDLKVIYHPYEGTRASAFEVYDRRTDRLERTDLAPAGAAADLRSRLERMTAESAIIASKRAAGPEQRPEMTEQLRKRLESLGYLGK